MVSLGPDADRDAIRRRAFELVRDALTPMDNRAAIDWLEDVIKILRDEQATARRSVAEAYFSPGEECPSAILRMLRSARRSVSVCVFTITDDRIADALIEIHRKGVSVQIITDNEKADDLGSDVGRLEQAGIPLRVDRSPFHMHHKFAIVDGCTLLTGSYNWTRGAARDNEENFVVTDDPRLVTQFIEAFGRLWAKLA